MKRFVGLQEHFSAAHLYHQKEWTEDQNKAHFGLCFSKFGHGHNYIFEVWSPIDLSNLPQTEYLLNRVVSQIKIQLEHQHLNFQIPEFETKIPTTENLAKWIKIEIEKMEPSLKDLSVTVFEDKWLGSTYS